MIIVRIILDAILWSSKLYGLTLRCIQVGFYVTRYKATTLRIRLFPKNFIYILLSLKAELLLYQINLA